jgi:hypothetical protein
MGIRAVEPSIGARCIGIRAVEARCPIICAVAVETAKTHATTQLRRRMNFFQFITLWVSKKLNWLGFERFRPCRIGKVTPLLLFTFSRTATSES